MQAASTMTLSSNTDTSFRGKKIVTFNSKMEFAWHHNNVAHFCQLKVSSQVYLFLDTDVFKECQ